MHPKFTYIVIGVIVLIFVLALLTREYQQSFRLASSAIDISGVLSDDTETSDFLRALKPIKFTFPVDHGSHPRFQTEWWYFTGNLKDEKNNHFGYQLTFFRRALSDKNITDESAWRTNTIYFAHFAITDVSHGQYYSYEKWSRGIPELAGAKAGSLKVWIDDWTAELKRNNVYKLNSKSENKSLSLLLKPSKKIVYHGEGGLSQKSEERGNASYYYSHTRLDTSGQLVIDDREYTVYGNSWFDHEWSTSALGAHQKGWDWFSVQLDDGSEIMLYLMRKKDGTIDSISSGTYVSKSGRSYHLTSADFKVYTKDYWKSTKTNIKYPSKWRIEIPRYDLSLNAVPVLNAQEFNHSFTYWEGSVKLSDDNVRGLGYVELTGY